MNLFSILKVPEKFEHSNFFELKKAKFLNFLLLIFITVFIWMTWLNLFVLEQPRIAILASVLGGVLLFSLIYFRSTQQLLWPSLMVVSSTAIMLIIIILNAKGQRDAASLIIIFPLITYQLLSTRLANYIYFVVSVVIVVALMFSVSKWPLVAPVATFFNVFAAIIIGGAIVHYLKSTIDASLEEMYVQSTKDSLTNILNRAEFTKLFTLEQKRTSREKSSFALVMFDIDNFKNINDQYGHQMGDAILIQFTSVINGSIRESDSFARWGGEEFMLLMPLTDLESAKTKTEKILQEIRSTHFKEEIRVTSSAGVIEFNHSEDIESCFRRVDEGLYQAKGAGRDQLVAIEPLSAS